MSELIFKPEDFEKVGWGVIGKTAAVMSDLANQKYQEWVDGLDVVYSAGLGDWRDVRDINVNYGETAYIFGQRPIKQESCRDLLREMCSDEGSLLYCPPDFKERAKAAIEREKVGSGE